jgi:hypothetical protein
VKEAEDSSTGRQFFWMGWKSMTYEIDGNSKKHEEITGLQKHAGTERDILPFSYTSPPAQVCQTEVSNRHTCFPSRTVL